MFRFRTLTMKVLVSFSLLFLITFTVFVFLAYRRFADEIDTNLKENLRRTVFNARLLAESDQSVEEIREGLSKIGLGETGYIYVMDEQGTLVIHPSSEGENLAGRPHIDEMLSKREGIIAYAQTTSGSNQGRSKLGAYTYAPGRKWIIVAAPFEDEFYGGLRATLMLLIAFGAASFVVFFAAGFLIGRGIAGPIRSTSTALAEIAVGSADLRRHLPIRSRDEIADLSTSFNRFVDKLRDLVSRIAQSIREADQDRIGIASSTAETAASVEEIAATVESVKHRALGLQDSAVRLSSSVSEIADGITGLDRFIETQAAAVEESSASTDEMTASIRSVSRSAGEKALLVQKLLATTRTGKDGMSGTSRKVDELTRRVEQLMEVVKVINDISARTNLLAMNAAIEAAHAGDAGRGFSVVADEIRKLATSASQNATVIGETLKESIANIEDLRSAAVGAVSSYHSIEQNAEGVAEAFAEINAAMQELSSGTLQLTRTASSLRDLTGDVRSGARKMANETRSLTAETAAVDRLSREVTDAVTEISTGAGQISDTMQTLNGDIQKISERIGDIRVQVERFST